MRAPGDALAHWHEFYMLLGTAAGTLVGLLFVAATVGAGVFSSDRPAPLRIFLSASVVHFSSVLMVSLIVLAPVETGAARRDGPGLRAGRHRLLRPGLARRGA